MAAVPCDVGGTTPAEMGDAGAKSTCHSNETLGELTKVSGYVDFIRALKPDPQNIVVSVIAGPSTPVAVSAGPVLAHSCNFTRPSSDVETADPSVRQTQFLEAFPNRSAFTSICNDDLGDGLVTTAQLLKAATGSTCFTAPLAVPYDCSVTVTVAGLPPETAEIVPECTTTETASCWTLAADSAQCGSDGLALDVKRDGQPLSAGSRVSATCATDLGSE